MAYGLISKKDLNCFQRWLLKHLLNRFKEMDKIGNYMHRYWLWRKKDKNKWQYRLHKILRSDYGFDLHNHPAWYWTIILSGGYWEITMHRKADDIPDNAVMVSYLRRGGYIVRKWYGAGSILFRTKEHYHRLVIEPSKPTTWTFFIFGKVADRDWGFNTEQGFSSHKKYLGEHDGR